MPDPALVFFQFLAALSFIAALGSLLDGVRFRRRVRRARDRTWGDYAPPAVVIVAAKGVDPGLAENLAALLDQDYSSYRVVFALDSLEDPAREIIRRAAADASVPVRVVRADPMRTCTGKAAALIRAARELGDGDEVVAFMDSDARPPRHWLRALVAPLQDPSIGATTTYRWYAHGEDLPSAVRAAWNGAGTNILFHPRYNFAWGGSSALRRGTFDRTHIAAKWGTALSDDMVVTQAVKGVGLRVQYVPQATVLTEEPDDWRATVEWTTRQTLMMRAYDPRVIRYAAAAYATVTGSTYLGLALAAVALFANPAYGLPAALLLSHLPLTAAKAAIRLRTFRAITGADLGPMGTYVVGSLVVPWLTLFVMSRARRLRVFSWRGTLYELRGPAPVRVLRR